MSYFKCKLYCKQVNSLGDQTLTRQMATKILVLPEWLVQLEVASVATIVIIVVGAVGCCCRNVWGEIFRDMVDDDSEKGHT